jgi:peptidyl-prolyl cis-trans isomerase SurA
MLFKFFIKFILSIFFFSHLCASEVKIIYKINNEIITNVDVKSEYQYLVALNKNLENLSENDLMSLAKDSIFREKIKRIAIESEAQPEVEIDLVEQNIKNIYKNLNLNSISEFKSYLKNNDLNYDYIFNKIETEVLWNKIIYLKYRNKININEEKLKRKVNDNIKNVEKLFLQEIIFEYNKKEDLLLIYNEILDFININGFDKTVLKYSIATTRKNNGIIGWVNKNNLPNNIAEEISNLKIGDISKPIIIPGGALLIKIENKKIEKNIINMQDELDKLIQFQINNQLNRYSIIHFNNLKKEFQIYEG